MDPMSLRHGENKYQEHNLYFVPSLRENFYRIWYGKEVERLIYRFKGEVTRGLGKIAEKCWERLGRDEIRLRKRFADAKNPEYVYTDGSEIPIFGYLLVLEHKPIEPIEFTEMKKRSERKTPKVVIDLEEKAKDILSSLYARGMARDFIDLLKSSNPEDALTKMGYYRKIYELLKLSVHYLEERAKVFSLKRERQSFPRGKLLAIVGVLLLSLTLFLIPSNISGLATLPSTFNPLLWLAFFCFFLLIILFWP